jgi:ribosome maturation factor RimP
MGTWPTEDVRVRTEMTPSALQQTQTSGAPAIDPNKTRVFEVIAGLIAPLGYEVVHFEIQTHRMNVLRLFIDHLSSGNGLGTPGIGVEDCAKVSRTLDEPLDLLPELNALFHGNSYELEVSSPGVDRPLRGEKDFARFAGRDVRIHTFRPLTRDEAGNDDYVAKNPKQKNFVGRLLGLVDGSSARLAVRAEAGDTKNKKKKSKAVPQTAATEISIPVSLISKANIEPNFEELEEMLAKSEKSK